MLYSEFLELSGIKASQEALNEYARANVAYMCCNHDKDVFCKVWHYYRNSEVVNGLIDEINRLQAQIAQKSEILHLLSLTTPDKIQQLKGIIEEYLEKLQNTESSKWSS